MLNAAYHGVRAKKETNVFLNKGASHLGSLNKALWFKKVKWRKGGSLCL